MGKGDRKTAKGKRYNASYGNARQQLPPRRPGTAGARREEDRHQDDGGRQGPGEEGRGEEDRFEGVILGRSAPNEEAPQSRGFLLSRHSNRGQLLLTARASISPHARSRFPPRILRMSASEYPRCINPSTSTG